MVIFIYKATPHSLSFSLTYLNSKMSTVASNIQTALLVKHLLSEQLCAWVHYSRRPVSVVKLIVAVWCVLFLSPSSLVFSVFYGIIVRAATLVSQSSYVVGRFFVVLVVVILVVIVFVLVVPILVSILISILVSILVFILILRLSFLFWCFLFLLRLL